MPIASMAADPFCSAMPSAETAKIDDPGLATKNREIAACAAA
jgi:hypothetical protein